MRPPELEPRANSMARMRFLGFLALAASGSLACSPTEGREPAQPAEAPLPDPEEAGLVTPEEAEVQASQQITPENADQELERLSDEVDGG